MQHNTCMTVIITHEIQDSAQLTEISMIAHRISDSRKIAIVIKGMQARCAKVAQRVHWKPEKV